MELDDVHIRTLVQLYRDGFTITYLADMIELPADRISEIIIELGMMGGYIGPERRTLARE